MFHRSVSETAPSKPGIIVGGSAPLHDGIDLAVAGAVVPLGVGEVGRLLAALLLDDRDRHLRLDRALAPVCRDRRRRWRHTWSCRRRSRPAWTARDWSSRAAGRRQRRCLAPRRSAAARRRGGPRRSSGAGAVDGFAPTTFLIMPSRLRQDVELAGAVDREPQVHAPAAGDRRRRAAPRPCRRARGYA